MAWHVFIPDSLLEEANDPKIKAYKVGQVARACAIFGVEHIWIYKAGGKDGKFIKLLLEYAETPQYLRKRIFPITPELKYAGVIPPLQIPSHKPKAPPRIGEIREGYAYRKGKKLFADIGLDRPALIKGVAREGRATFKIISVNPLRVIPAEPSEYWGYKVHLSRKTLAKTLKKANLDVVIATSRKGVDVRSAEVPLEGEVGIVFGSPKKGVIEILKEYNEDYEFDLILNTIPEQKTKTVRTEEALLATLAIFNFMRKRGD